jgi:kynurenine 3-monooxygenase
MRDLVAQPKFQLKKKVEQVLQQRFPGRFIPKYSMVTFHRVPYSVALFRGRVQDGILDELCTSINSPEEVDVKRAETLIQTKLTPLYV